MATGKFSLASSSNSDMAAKLAALDKSQAIIEFYPDGTIITANENFLGAVGYSLQEIQGNHHSMFAEPEYAKSQEYRNFWKRLANGEFQAAQYKRLAKGGKEIWIEASYNPLFDKKGNVYKVVKFATDITQKQLEYADMQGQVSAISRSQAVIEFELDGTIITANENFLAVMGYPLSAIQGKHHSMFAEPGVAESQEYKDFWKTLREGTFQAGQYKRLAKGGKEIWIEASYNPILDPNGKPFKVIKFATDLTPRKHESAELANNFEQNVQSLVQTVAESSSRMESTAQSLSCAAKEASGQSGSVAAATEELSASVNEISSQVANSVKIVGEAVSKAHETEGFVNGLLETANEIGNVVSLISDIADQTNLLALNATIEAARAGEAGKGFAVVASEVKTLAAETSNATDEISTRINNIQNASQSTAESIRQITEIIQNVSEISTVISGAVEEQTAATQDVSMNISGVQSASNETGQSASVVLDVAQSLSNNAEDLQKGVDDFLQKVRTM